MLCITLILVISRVPNHSSWTACFGLFKLQTCSSLLIGRGHSTCFGAQFLHSTLLYIQYSTVHTVLYCTYSTLLYIQYSTVHTVLYCTYSTLLYIQYSTVLYCTYSTLLYIQYSTVHTVLYCTYSTLLYIQYSTVHM